MSIAVGRQFKLRRSLRADFSTNEIPLVRTVPYGSVVSLVSSDQRTRRIEFKFGEEVFDIGINVIRDSLDLYYEALGVSPDIAKQIYDLDVWDREKIQGVVIQYEEAYKQNQETLNEHLKDALEKINIRNTVRDIIK